MKATDIEFEKTVFDRLLSFLTGASLALVFLGLFFAISWFYRLGFFTTISAMFIFSLPGFFCFVLVEIAKMHSKKLMEAKKQTFLLNEILNKINQK